jgi:hypothetical protein
MISSNRPSPRFGHLLLSICFVPALIACGDAGTPTAPISFALSDAPVEDLDSVVITIDKITLNRPGHNDVVIDRFTNADLGVFDEDTITIDLLDYRGEDNVLIVGPVEVDVDEYQNLRIEVIESDITKSWVDEVGGGRKLIKVPSRELKLGRFEVTDTGDQTFILEFDLRRALTYNPGPDRYILKPRGIRIIEVQLGATLEGLVAAELFDGEPPCDSKADAFVGNVMYLYNGTGLDLDKLGDAFDPDLDLVAAATLLEPYASESVASDGHYMFAYLPAGAYTLAFSCDATGDDPDYDDGILIPSPVDEAIEFTIDPGTALACDFPLDVGGCSLIAP